jgi:RNA polymerase sigma-70 factor (ECF subfamily)
VSSKKQQRKSFSFPFDLYYQDIYGYSGLVFKSKELAEENVQEVFESLVTSSSKFRAIL